MLTLSAFPLSVSPSQLVAAIVAALALVAIAFFVGRWAGDERTQVRIFRQARDNGFDPRWLMPLPEPEDDGE